MPPFSRSRIISAKRTVQQLESFLELIFTRNKLGKPQRLLAESPGFRLSGLPTAWQQSSTDRFRASRTLVPATSSAATLRPGSARGSSAAPLRRSPASQNRRAGLACSGPAGRPQSSSSRPWPLAPSATSTSKCFSTLLRLACPGFPRMRHPRPPEGSPQWPAATSRLRARSSRRRGSGRTVCRCRGTRDLQSRHRVGSRPLGFKRGLASSARPQQLADAGDLRGRDSVELRRPETLADARRGGHSQVADRGVAGDAEAGAYLGVPGDQGGGFARRAGRLSLRADEQAHRPVPRSTNIATGPEKLQSSIFIPAGTRS